MRNAIGARASLRPVAPSLRSISSWALDSLLERRCVVCGKLLEPGSGGKAPLCPACSGLLQPAPGERCVSCGLPLISERGTCLRCRGIASPFEGARALFAYEGAFKALLGAYKFGDRRSLAPFLASLAEKEIASRWPLWTIVPVPPRPGKLRVRGWDQVEELARELERGGCRVARLLVRLSTRQQKRLGRAERRENALASYALAPGARSPGLCLLIDDVVTTGATSAACGRALAEGGASRIAFLALAAD